MAIYINRIFFVKNTKGAIINALYSINWGHRVVGLTSPTENSLVKLAYEGALRLIGGKVSKKDALPIEVVKDVVDKFKLSPGNLLHMRTIVVILLGFCGGFRINELLSIKLGDMTFLPDQLKVFLDVSKCDQHRQGNTVVIARTGSRYCPVTFVEDFLKRAGLDAGKDKEAFLIPRLHVRRKSHRASKSLGVTDDTVRQDFKTIIEPHTKDGSNYSLHSLRSGGASRAANQGINDRLIAKQGRWSTEKGKNGYIKDSNEARKSVTLALGL